MFQNQNVVLFSEGLTVHRVGSFIARDCHLSRKTGVILPDHLGEKKGVYISLSETQEKILGDMKK